MRIRLSDLAMMPPKERAEALRKLVRAARRTREKNMKKDAFIYVRMTRQEVKKLQAAARKQKLTVAEYVRLIISFFDGDPTRVAAVRERLHREAAERNELPS